MLRKWYDLRPEREWRCFVAGGKLVGVCQRDVTQHFPQLAEPVGGWEALVHEGRGTCFLGLVAQWHAYPSP